MYQSIVEKLNISAEELLTIDEAQIIKFEKLLKSKTVIENDGLNAEDNSKIISKIRDPEHRKFVYVIEKHPKLKSFLSKKIQLESKTLSINQNVINALNLNKEGFRNFLEPYFKDLLLPQLKKALNENKFVFVLDKVKNDWLFSEDIKFECQKLVLNKVSVVIHQLKTVIEPKTIAYINGKGFSDLIKHESNGLGMDYLKSYIETLAKQLQNVHPRTKRASLYAETLIEIKNTKIDNETVNEFLDAHISAYFSNVISKKKSPEEWGQQIGITALLIAIIFISSLIYKASNEKIEIVSYTQKDTTKYKEAFEQLYGSQMKNDAMGVLKSIEAKLILKAYQYPYSIKNELSLPLFYPIYDVFPEADSIYKNTVTIENLDVEKSLIVFRKNKYNHCAILKPRERLTTFLEPNDSLIFYKGKDLNISDFTSPKDPLTGIFKESNKRDRIQFFQVYVVDSLFHNKNASIQMTNYGILKFNKLKTIKKTTSYVGKNFIDVRLLDSYLD